jgi:hypothetical protein
MYAMIQSTDRESFYIAQIVENQRGVYQWRYMRKEQDKLGVPFADLDDAISVLREARLGFKNPKTKMLVIDGRSVRLTLDEIDYEDPEKAVD